MLKLDRRLTRGRLVLLASTVVVVVGVVGGLAALFLNPARAAVGPLPAAALVLPADVRFVMGLDVRRFAASPFYERYAVRRGLQPRALIELEERTGLDPAKDLDEIVVAGSTAGAARDALAVATGRFDRNRLARTLEAQGKVRTYNHEGVTVYALRSDGSQGMALSFPSGDSLVFGPKERVEAAVSSRVRGEAPLRANAKLVALVETIRPGSTFWMAGDGTFLAGLPFSNGGSGSAASAAMFNLPALRGVTVNGDLDPLVSLSVTGEAADEPAAKGLADVVRGLIALLTIQAQQRPELQQLASAVNVTTDANRVLVSARVPYALLDALPAGASTAPSPAPATAPSSSPSSPPQVPR